MADGGPVNPCGRHVLCAVHVKIHRPHFSSIRERAMSKLKRGPMRRISVVLMLVIGIGRPIAAQTVTLPVAAASTSEGSPAAQASAGPDPIASLGALSSLVKPTDRIYVRKTSGEEIVGRFSHASQVSLTLEVEGRMRDVPAADVQQVWQRGASQAKRGMLFGFLAGAAIADIALTASSSESDWSTGDKIFLGTLAGGGAGLIWGGLIGAFIHERTVVYRAAGPTVRVMPLLASDRFGVMLAARF